jgi:hypothetical protein
VFDHVLQEVREAGAQFCEGEKDQKILHGTRFDDPDTHSAVVIAIWQGHVLLDGWSKLDISPLSSSKQSRILCALL